MIRKFSGSIGRFLQKMRRTHWSLSDYLALGFGDGVGAQVQFTVWSCKDNHIYIIEVILTPIDWRHLCILDFWNYFAHNALLYIFDGTPHINKWHRQRIY